MSGLNFKIRNFKYWDLVQHNEDICQLVESPQGMRYVANSDFRSLKFVVSSSRLGAAINIHHSFPSAMRIKIAYTNCKRYFCLGSESSSHILLHLIHRPKQYLDSFSDLHERRCFTLQMLQKPRRMQVIIHSSKQRQLRFKKHF